MSSRKSTRRASLAGGSAAKREREAMSRGSDGTAVVEVPSDTPAADLVANANTGAGVGDAVGDGVGEQGPAAATDANREGSETSRKDTPTSGVVSTPLDGQASSTSNPLSLSPATPAGDSGSAMTGDILDSGLNSESQSSPVGASSATTMTAEGAVDPAQSPPAPVTDEDRFLASKELPGSEDKSHHDSLYVAMELEYDGTWQEIAEDVTLNPFRTEYEKMHRAVTRSRDHIEKLFAQYERTYGDYTVHLAQTQDAKEASVHDQQLLKSLRAQIAKAENTVEASNKREESGKEELRQLRLEVANLNSTLKQGVGLSTTQEKVLQELLTAKERSTKELDEELEKIVHLRNSIANVSDRIKSADQQKRDLEREIYDLRDRSASKKSDIDAELRNKERLERDLRELRVVVAVKSQEVRGKQDSVNRATDDISILESQIRSQKHMTEKLVKDQESLTVRTAQLQQEADEQMAQTSQLIEENRIMANELNRREAELLKNTTEVKKVARIKDTLTKKIQASEEQKLEAEMERKGIRGECEGTLEEADKTKRQIDMHKKSIDDLTRERDILEKNFHKAQTEFHNHGQMIMLSKQTRHNIELDMGRYEREILDQEKKIKSLEEQRDTYIVDAIRLQASCVAGIQEMKNKEIDLFDYKKRTVQADTKLKHQQNLYEAVQSDRNLHSKHLIEAQAEISKMKRKLKIMNFQINGFKEDIGSKNQALTAEATQYARLQKDIEVITEEINTLQHQNELGQAYIRTQSAEASKLNQFVKEAEMERSRQENALNILITERDNLSNQLIRQNDELAKAYNALQLQQVSLLHSENHYSEHIVRLNVRRREISELRRDRAVLKLETTEHVTTCETARKLENDLLVQRMRIKALEDQLRYPINVHRWRKLEGKNPKAFDMIQLLHSLQRKLISKSKEETDKEQLIQSKEMLYLYLKTLLAKQIGPEAIEQISEYRHILKDKTVQFRHMGTELNMYQAQLREYRYTISQLDKGMEVMKRQYIQQNRGKVTGTGSPSNMSTTQSRASGFLKGQYSGVPLPALPTAVSPSPSASRPSESRRPTSGGSDTGSSRGGFSGRQSRSETPVAQSERFDSPDHESVFQQSTAFAAEENYGRDEQMRSQLEEPFDPDLDHDHLLPNVGGYDVGRRHDDESLNIGYGAEEQRHDEYHEEEQRSMSADQVYEDTYTPEPGQPSEPDPRDA